ncbi:MAG: RNA polymerase sigma factor, partial [Planctomycetota bacterium]
MSEANPEISLNDVAWLTALARTLTRDEAEADDLVQDTWVAARTSPPRSGGVNRPWLATALRRFHLQSLRANRRRVRRGQAAARHEALPDTAELVERTELQRTLADCLISLEEPYRTTLMLVTFEDVSTAEIAERDGVSVSVVRYRVRKAREMMRAKLMATNGEDWSQWHAALLPFASLPFPGKAAALTAAAASHVAPKSAWFGVLAMSVKLMVILSPLVAVLAALYLVRPTPTDDLSVVERSVQSDPGATVAALPSELASQTVRVAGSGAPEIPSANSASEAPGIALEEERPAHASDPQLATLEMRIRSPHGGWSAGLMADEAPFLDGTRPRWNAAELEDERPRQITGAWGKGRAVGAHSDRRKDGVYKWVNVRP